MSTLRWLVLALSLLPGVPAAAGQSITVSAAISMKDAVTEVGRGFAAARPGVTVLHNWGSSGELQKQIEAGAPVDVFISAAQLQMDELEKRGLVVPATRRVFARNVLTVIKPGDSRVDIAKAADLADPRLTRIVVGNPKTVPAGQYAEESLRALGLWDRVRAKLIFAENVRQALDYVARGEVDAGFVYSTDAAVRGRAVREAFRPAEDTYRPIVYPAAVVAATREPALARAFVERLVSREGQLILARFGFQPPPAGAR
ncbi:MAG TPA: molybdate ABC transporter substrate-binding protein [Methylomirabilota bacterium]|nr:molybdate ABC transporter substrate-binding protein [Methylomirabilota bacterium]